MKKKGYKTVIKPRGLVGLYVHLYKDGAIKYQGQIIGREDDKALVQMFEWGMGEPTNVRAFDLSVIYSDDCKLYADADIWRECGNKTFK